MPSVFFLLFQWASTVKVTISSADDGMSALRRSRKSEAEAHVLNVGSTTLMNGPIDRSP